MKTVIVTPESSVRSTNDDDQSEIRDNSCYFPGCRKDANCNCEMCLDSINATLDLMPPSSQRTTLTKLSTSRPISRSPISFDPSALSTPKSRISPVVVASPPIRSTGRMSFQGKIGKKKKKKGKEEMWFWRMMAKRLILGVNLIFVVEFGFSWVVSRGFQPKLSKDVVRNLGEESWALQDLDERIFHLSKKIHFLVGGKNLNGSSIASEWEVIQDGLLLHSRCILYKTAAEDVTIWGWPLQTAGLLTTAFSSKSFTILSGRVTEWTNGKAAYLIRKANSSWEQGKWSASVVHFDKNTWILEYKRSSITENEKLLSAVLELLNFRITRQLQKIKQEFWLLFTFANHFRESADNLKVPT